MKFPTYTRGNVKIEWVDLGESINGDDWNEGDPEEEAVLRFDVYFRKTKNSAWSPVDDASYCTQVPANTPKKTLKKLLIYLMNEYEPILREGFSVRKLSERLSWITPNVV